MGNGSRKAAAPDAVDPSTPLPRPLSPASGPSGCPCSCSAFLPGSSSSSGAAPTPRAHPADSGAPADVHHSPPLAPPRCLLRSSCCLPPHQTRSPLLCLCIGWSQHLGGLAASPTWNLLQVSGRDHFCDTFAHWLWQIWEPAGLSCLIHAPPLSPATSNSHLPPAAASGTQRG